MTRTSWERQAEQQGARCSPEDEALAASYAGREVNWQTLHVEPQPPQPPQPPLSERIRALLLPWSDEELEAAKVPHPHVFSVGDRGIFPIGEVSIVGARGREGKTTILTAIATAGSVGQSLIGMVAPGMTTVIYSAEDDRAQYARKIGAQMGLFAADRREKLRHRILVPDLDTPGVAEARELVMVLDRQPVVSGTVEALIEALRPLLDNADAPLRMVVFETASTLSDAEEDNRGHKVLVAALKRIARALCVAVVLVHHTSQQADNSLADLTVSTADIRGGTSLVFNGRQTWLLVNLGSDIDPFPEADARTVLRRMVCDGNLSTAQDRLLAMIALDSSKSAPVPPIFFRWIDTDYGPAAVEIEAPLNLVDRPWRKVHEMVRAERAELRDQAKAARTSATVDARVQRVIDCVARLQQTSDPVTVRRVREKEGMSSSVAGQALTAAVTAGQLLETTISVRGKDTVVYAVSSRGTSRDNRGGQ